MRMYVGVRVHMYIEGKEKGFCLGFQSFPERFLTLDDFILGPICPI